MKIFKLGQIIKSLKVIYAITKKKVEMTKALSKFVKKIFVFNVTVTELKTS